MGSNLFLPEDLQLEVSEFVPTVPQDQFLFSEYPYPAIVAGFGAGKTKSLVMRSIMGKLVYADPRYNRAFYEPTYDLMRQIAWPEFHEALDTAQIPYKLYKSPYNYIDIEGCGKIIFRSMDTPAKIIGYQVMDSDIDELDTLSIDDAAEVWRRALSRNRQKKPDGKPNTIGVGTTPEGFRFVYEMWAKDPKRAESRGYKYYTASTYSNPHLPEGYVQSLIDMYPESLIMAYVEGKFVNLTTGSVYASYNRERCRSKEKVKTRETVHIGMDFNVGRMCGKVFVERSDGWHLVDELDKVLDTPTMIELICDRYQARGNPCTIYPDASGKNRSSKGASITDIALLRKAGFKIKAPMRNPRVKDRYQSVNVAFDKRHLFVNDTTCPNAAECLDKQAFDKNGEPEKGTGFDDSNDAMGYFVHWQMPVTVRTDLIAEDLAPVPTLNYFNKGKK